MMKYVRKHWCISQCYWAALPCVRARSFSPISPLPRHYFVQSISSPVTEPHNKLHPPLLVTTSETQVMTFLWFLQWVNAAVNIGGHWVGSQRTQCHHPSSALIQHSTSLCVAPPGCSAPISTAPGTLCPLSSCCITGMAQVLRLEPQLHLVGAQHVHHPLLRWWVLLSRRLVLSWVVRSSPLGSACVVAVVNPSSVARWAVLPVQWPAVKSKQESVS